MSSLKQLAMAVLTIAILGASARDSRARVVPYEAIGTGVYSPLTGEYSGSGLGTPLGRHTFLGYVATSPTANPLVYNFQSTVPQITVDANGDTISFTSSGQVHLIPLDQTMTTFTAIWTGEFVVVGGTGRFAKVEPGRKPLQVVALNNPFTFEEPEWTFSWILSGTINLN